MNIKLKLFLFSILISVNILGFAVDIDGDGLHDYHLTGGSDHTCVIDSIDLHCWGHNYNGQTDIPDYLVNPKQVSAGTAHTCAIDDNGLHCWGSNGSGESNVPNNLKSPLAVSTGQYVCA